MFRAVLLIALLSFPVLVVGQNAVSAAEASIKKYSEQIGVTSDDATVAVLYLQRGLTYFRIQSFANASADIKIYLDKRSNNRFYTSALFNLGLCYEHLKDWKGAAVTYTELLNAMSREEKIDGKVSWTDVLDHRMSLWKKLNLPYAVYKDMAAAGTHQAQIDSLFNANHLVFGLQVDPYRVLKVSNSRRLSIAQNYSEENNFAQSIETLASDINDPKSPTRLTARLLRGFDHAANNNLEAAKADFVAVVEESPEFNMKGLANYYYSFVLAASGNVAEAQRAILEAAKIFTSEKSWVSVRLIEQQKEFLNKPGATVARVTSPPAIVKADTVEKKIRVAGGNTTGDQRVVEKREAVLDKQNAQTNAKNLTGAALEIFNLTQRINSEPSNTALYLQRGQAFFNDRQYSAALVDLNNFKKFSGEGYKGQADMLRANSYVALNQPDRAIGVYSEMLKNIKDADLASMQIQRKDILSARAHLYLKGDNLLAASNDYQKVATLDPADKNIKRKIDSIQSLDPLFRILTYDAFTFLGPSLSKRLQESERAYHNGEFDQSLTLVNEEISRSAPTANFAQLLKGFVLMSTRQYETASAEFQKSLLNNITIEQKGLISFYQAFIYQKLENPDEAINSISESLKIFSSDKSLLPYTMLLLRRAELFEQQGFKSEAVKDYDAYLAVRPGDSKVRQRREAAQSGKKEEPPVAEPVVKKEPVIAKKEPSLRDVFAGEKRYALIIGNSDYPAEIGKLNNPANDADDLRAELEKSDFEVTLIKNVTFRQIEVAANNFYKKLNDGPKDQTVGLFYYSGHGVQYEGQNYLVPVDASVTVPEDIRYVCYPADKILGKMEFANARMNIIILDACRSNPFPVASRSVEAGLAQARAARGSYVAFATAPGSTASDGAGRNGLYTQELLKALRIPKLPIEQVFKEVRLNVSKLSGGKQNTWDNSNIVGEFYFKLDN